MSRSKTLMSDMDEVNYEKLKKLNTEADHLRFGMHGNDPKKKQEIRDRLKKNAEETRDALKEE